MFAGSFPDRVRGAGLNLTDSVVTLAAGGPAVTDDEFAALGEAMKDVARGLVSDRLSYACLQVRPHFGQ